jgi:hypothetical protein
MSLTECMPNFINLECIEGGDMNLFLFLFPVFCILKEQELRGTNYMKDVVLYEGNPTKFDLYFSELYFI